MGDKLNHRDCIYYIINTINGKGYIGQTVYLRKRINEHKRNAKIGKQSPLYNAINKYGWENFEVIVLEENLSKKDGFSSDCVGNCIVGKQQQHKGYKWYYLNEKGAIIDVR